MFIEIDGPRHPHPKAKRAQPSQIMCQAFSPDGIYVCTREVHGSAGNSMFALPHVAMDHLGNELAEWQDGDVGTSHVAHWDNGLLRRGPAPGAAPANPTPVSPASAHSWRVSMGRSSVAAGQDSLTPRPIKETNQEVDEVDCIADDYNPVRDGPLPSWRDI